ncbi:hypothetical protein C9383_15805 [Pseudomonas palleroniana]|uniref:Uncharacterized protein n=1 Tax=Pseudomonas palleroniana TaxID=191390 RepID=A0A1H5LQ85_9PSED|nr:hypothetical protein [Pseudomonas palleroniana]KAB0566579.1 hypothetical protein F7R03_13450 [Pseudomonas palleroniana]PTC25565.1 hypothetical protein C9383_15805 [Pseudomonas palleroniana]SEE79150.1 hypothetical protein SAMN04490198_2864 [Pseudomonas palleroniana]
MQAPTPNGSGLKATTTSPQLQAVALVGGALIGFLVMKTPEARSELESVTARSVSDLSAQDARIIQELLATHLPAPKV